MVTFPCKFSLIYSIRVLCFFDLFFDLPLVAALHFDLVLLYAEVDHGSADLDSLIVEWDEGTSLFDEDHGAEFRVIVFENEFTVHELDHGVHSRDGDIVYSQISVVASAQFELLLLNRRLDHMDDSARVLFVTETLEYEEVTCWLLILDQVILFIFGFKS